jgi:hypothetical protein
MVQLVWLSISFAASYHSHTPVTTVMCVVFQSKHCLDERADPHYTGLKLSPSIHALGANMRRALFLLIWILAIIFPVGWFVQILPFGYHFFNQVFKYEWAHIVGHLVIFTVIGVVLSRMFCERFSTRSFLYRFVWIALVVVVVAAAQEAFQIVSLGRTVGPAEFFDLATDLAGALLGTSAEQILARHDGSLRWTPPDMSLHPPTTE